MYKYKHILRLANHKLSNETNLSDYEKNIIAAVEYYNSASQHAKNSKKIIECSVYPKYIEIISESNELLARPNVALQLFSRYLSTNGLEKLIKNKLLFKGSAERIMEEKMSDEEILLEVIGLFYKKDKNAREKIKQIRNIIEK